MGRKRGPVIGVFATPARGESWNHQRYGERSSFLRELLRAAAQRGAVGYVFGPGDLDWEAGLVRGAALASDDAWVQREFPFPEVIYDRIPSVRTEERPEVAETKERLRCLVQGRYFNPGFLNKWTLYRMMGRARAGGCPMPPTKLAEDFEQVKTLLHQYETVYLKPCYGSLGRGIVRVDRLGSKGFLVRLPRTGLSDREIRVSNEENLFHVLNQRLRWGRYVAQRGLRLARCGGRPFDLRFLAQKNAWGRWIVSSAVARLAHPGSAVSNVARGGEITGVASALEGAFGLSSREARMKLSWLRRRAVRLARAIEEASGQHYGELGLDLAVDDDGRAWFLEANSKPAREPLPGDRPHGVRASARRLITYCFYLAGYRRKRRPSRRG